MNTTTMTPSELQQALKEMTAERDALQEQVDDYGEPEVLASERDELEAERDELKVELAALEEERDEMAGCIDDWGEPEQLYEQLSEAEHANANMEKERDDAREEVKDLWHDFTNAEEEVEKLEKQLAAAAKPTPPPIAPRRKSPPAAHKAQYYNTHMLIKRCGYGYGYNSIFEYTAYGWGSCDRTADGSWQVDCPDKAFVWPDYEDTKILAMMN